MATHVRKNSAVVPVVPRIFEKRIAQTSKDTRKQTTAREDYEELPISSQNLSNERQAAPQNGVLNGEYGSSQVPSYERIATPKQLSPSPEKSTSQDTAPAPVGRVNTGRTGERQPRVSLPPRFVPGQTSSPIVYPIGTSLGAFPNPPSRPTYSLSLHKIAFGSFGTCSESSESSPTIPPSATSTRFTQPTPVSEARSQASQSEHEAAHAKTQSSDEPRSVSEPDNNPVLIGPYRPGLMAGHLMDFLKFRQNFLAQHLHELYHKNDGDVSIDILFKSNSFRYNLHSAILAQSPMISAAIQLAIDRNEFSSERKVRISIGVQDHFTSIAAIEGIFKSMYGIPVFDVKLMEQQYIDPQNFYAMFAASCLLGLPGHQIFSSNCIMDLLNWRTLADAFDLCLAGRRFSACTDPFPKRSDEIVSPLFQPQASPILERAISVMVQDLNESDFCFEKFVPNFPSLGGQPPPNASVEISVSSSNSNRGIVFGDLNNNRSAKNSVLSSLLLSLPLPVLQRLAAEINVAPNANGPNLMELVIYERERRRVASLEVADSKHTYKMKETYVIVDFLPNGIGIVNEMHHDGTNNSDLYEK